MCSCYRVSLPAETPSGSVHARVRRLEAMDREKPHLYCPHRPAPRCGPELLPVPRAAEFLSRPACRSRLESPVTPQAASTPDGVLGRFEFWGDRSAAKVCGNYSLARRYDCGFHRFRG